jgi:hypothetical protein
MGSDLAAAQVKPSLEIGPQGRLARITQLGYVVMKVGLDGIEQ